MVIESILAQIDAEIARLTQVRKLLSASGSVTLNTRATKAKAASGKARKKRVLSAEARRRIADAQKRRWAAQKAKAKKEG
jgi:hypothetical protein